MKLEIAPEKARPTPKAQPAPEPITQDAPAAPTVISDEARGALVHVPSSGPLDALTLEAIAALPRVPAFTPRTGTPPSPEPSEPEATRETEPETRSPTKGRRGAGLAAGATALAAGLVATVALVARKGAPPNESDSGQAAAGGDFDARDVTGGSGVFE